MTYLLDNDQLYSKKPSYTYYNDDDSPDFRFTQRDVTFYLLLMAVLLPISVLVILPFHKILKGH